MKFSLIATLVVLALAQGSLAQEMPDFEKIAQYFEEMKTRMTSQMSEIIGSQDLQGQAQTFLEDRKAQLEPLAAQIQGQLTSITSNLEEQIKPLAASMQAQLQPMIRDFQTQMEGILAQMTEQAKAIGQ
ncbi:hypothetical protein PAMA_011608 [Pampus argenteus]